VAPPAKDAELLRKIEGMALDRIRAASRTREKKLRHKAFDEIDAEVSKAIVTPFRDAPRELGSLAQVEAAQAAGRKLSADVKEILHDLRGKVMRDDILDGKPRIDGRSSTDIRPITASVGELGSPHGSALFTRGETQALVTVTLGGSRDEQMIEGLKETFYRNFFMHYNFLPFSTGEVRPLRAPNRREQGHGALAERAVRMVLPEGEDSPFTIRVVSEILESNGSSSMASVCGGALALMDAGIQIQAPVAGIAMGLISEGSRHAVLSDILGDEDHLGDMDFKVAGSTKGITAIQMDIKIDGLDWAVMEKALEQARQGRLHILQRMSEETATSLPGFVPRSELSANAPRVVMIWIKPDRIRDLIGPGGKVIRAIQETTGAKVDVEDSGKVTLFAPNGEALAKCQQMVEECRRSGDRPTYVGKVLRSPTSARSWRSSPASTGCCTSRRWRSGASTRSRTSASRATRCGEVPRRRPERKIRLSRRAALAEQPRKLWRGCLRTYTRAMSAPERSVPADADIPLPVRDAWQRRTRPACRRGRLVLAPGERASCRRASRWPSRAYEGQVRPRSGLVPTWGSPWPTRRARSTRTTGASWA
jgi:polyribonucleotide nucleotidyltransferase